MKAANHGITLRHSSLYVGHTNVLLLSGNDFPSQGWSEGHIVEKHIWSTQMLNSPPVRGTAGR
jgi:hypothetical protein